MRFLSVLALRRPSRALPLAGILVAAAAGSMRPALAGNDSGIVSHPDQLQFQPLHFEPPKAADFRVKIGDGLVAYVVPDRTIPLVTVNVILRIGSDLDPQGKEGLAGMTMYLLTRSGTKTRSAADLEARVGSLGAQLASGIGGGFGGNPFIPQSLGPSEASASINLLSKDVDEGLAILAECLKSPAWEAERVKLRKDQLMQDMKQRNDESAGIEQREWSVLMRGEGHWTNRWPTAQSVQSITTDDMTAFHRRYVGPKNFVIAVSGDFDRGEMVKKLEKTFASWPQPGERPGPPPAPAATSTPGWYLVDKDVNQARVSIGLTAIDRYDREWAAAQVMNDILGGGGFSSHLVNRIRSDEGLAYSVRSSFEGGTYYKDPWRTAFQTKVRSTAYAIQVGMTEIAHMRDSLVTAAELENSKNKSIDAFPTRFETASSIATQLANDEVTGRYERDPKFYAEYRDRIRAVTAADVQRVAQRLLDPAKMTVLLVGHADDIMLGDPKHPVTIATLASGTPKRLPLRDPLTMKPQLTP